MNLVAQKDFDRGGNGEAPPPGDGKPAMQSYLLWVVLGMLGTIVLLVGALIGLRAEGALPPPQISNNLCMDEKLLFMRANPPGQENLLVLGSSVAWRHFDGRTASEVAPSIRPYNAGLCGAQILQTARVADWLMPKLPAARSVLLIASPLDFQQCDGTDPARFDTEVADDYVFGQAPSWHFYARYFDPITLLRNAEGIVRLRTDARQYDSLVMDAYGDGPLMPRRSRGLFYDHEIRLDPACFTRLHIMAKRIGDRGAQLYFVPTPLRPDWAMRSRNEATMESFDRGLRRALAGTDARLIRPTHRFVSGDFVDAIHLRWSAAPQFTRDIVGPIAKPEGGGNNSSRKGLAR